MPDPNAAQHETDLLWMTRALDLATQGIGLASPNPTVGCVLVRDGVPVGEGFHRYDHRDHAEIVALKQAGAHARGATAYVTLEPCSHQGRTGPCANALTAAGVKRVVIATLDPNPSVNGQGAERLRAAGIEVLSGILQEPARHINNGFARWIQTRLPFVTLKAALTLDGRIAPPPGTHPPGSPFWITGEAARAEVQQMRHAVDAVITGIPTVLSDDPLLTDRSGLPRRRPLLRVVLDSKLRLPLDSQLVHTAQDDVLIFCSEPAPDREKALIDRGVRVERVRETAGHLDLHHVLARLGELQLTSVMLEAGSRLNGGALAAGIVDRLCLFYAPHVLGSHAVPVLHGEAALPATLSRVSVTPIGDDFRFEGYLRDPWQTAPSEPTTR